MTQINKTNKIFVQYILFGRGGSGGNNGQIEIDNRDGGVNQYDLNTNGGLDFYRWSPLIVNNTNNFQLVEGEDVASPSKILTRAEEITALKQILGFTKSRAFTKYYYAKGSTTAEGFDFDNLWTAITNMGTNEVMKIVIEYQIDNSAGNSAPTLCQGGVHYRWTASTLYVVFNSPINGEHLEVIATGVITQTDLETQLKAIYTVGQWNYAYDVNTGDICVTFKDNLGTNDGTFVFDVTLD